MGEPNYGSRGASINVETELDSHLGWDPSALHQRMAELFAVAREGVNLELARADHESVTDSGPASGADPADVPVPCRYAGSG
jgi:hypothetical protein